MRRLKNADTTVSAEAFEVALAIYTAALKEVVAAVLAALAAGARPSRSGETELSIRANGMPSMSDGWYNRSGPFDYPAVLDAPYNDTAARARGRYPTGEYPALEALLAFASDAAASANGRPKDLLQLFIRMQIEAAVGVHIDRFGQVEVADDTARAVLAPFVRGLLEKNLDIALLAPIALVNFDFRTARLSDKILIMKMSPELQRLRWSAKAYGAKGHDSVLSAATHAFVLLGWWIKNDDFIGLSNSLSWPWDNSSDEFERLFAALRLVTGIETGYAQEVRLARGWRQYKRNDRPEIFAAPARRYPEAFDNFGWLREDLPRITRSDVDAIACVLAALEATPNRSLALALRRLNAAATRQDPADAILDATIALEVLLGDKDNQSISWKLRMRAAALVGIGSDRVQMQAMYDDISTLYKERSTIVHGLERKANAPPPEDVRHLAIDALRRILRILVEHPRYLDPLKIDAELLLTANNAQPLSELVTE